MTKTYHIQARCLRPFVSSLEIEANSPEEALAQARLEGSDLIAAAKDSESWPWDEFTVCDQGGQIVLHALDAEDGLRETAPVLAASQQMALQDVMTAAENLLAAIHDATGQFDSEGAALDAACTTARAVLESAGRIDVHKLLAHRREIALIWSVDDVLQVRPGLTTKEAWKVLQEVERHHEAMLGVSWDTLACTADDLFGPAPESDAA